MNNEQILELFPELVINSSVYFRLPQASGFTRDLFEIHVSNNILTICEYFWQEIQDFDLSNPDSIRLARGFLTGDYDKKLSRYRPLDL